MQPFITLFIAFAWCTVLFPGTAPKQATPQFPRDAITIRVLLKRIPLNRITTTSFASPDYFIIKEHNDRPRQLKSTSFDLIPSRNHFVISHHGKKKRCHFPLKLTSKHQLIGINDTFYSGAITVKIHRNELLIINTLSLDDYIYSVLRFEIYQFWPLEMQKTQAVASRTYAVYHMIQARKRGEPFDVTNTNFHQNYSGTHPYTHLKQAVQETHNQVLLHNGTPALTMFDACCGGSIPATMDLPYFEKAPYLARKNRCTFCRTSSRYRWNHELSLSAFMQEIRKHKFIRPHLHHAGAIQKIHIHKQDKAGLAHIIGIKTQKKNLRFAGRKIIESLKNKLHSLCFSLKTVKHPKKGTLLQFSGKGYGHQIGLCQQGAYTLVRQGWPYKKILDFYYPDTKLVTLTKNTISRET